MWGWYDPGEQSPHEERPVSPLDDPGAQAGQEVSPLTGPEVPGPHA